VIKRYLGIDFVDLLIQIGITIPVCVLGATATFPQEEIGVAMVIAGSFGVLAWRRARAMKGRLDEAPGQRDQDRIAELEHRVSELEYAQGRVVELEERVDFQERLLVRQREELKLTPGETER
jgi:uncharacterized coiled-coil protein SlyX